MQVRRNKKMTICISTVLTLIVGLLIGTGQRFSTQDTADWAYNKNNLIRLHVVAHSDSAVDQALKYSVRDAVLEAAGQLLTDVITTEQAWHILRENLEYLRKRAEESVLASGNTHPISVELGEYEFPTKAYGNFVLAGGTYPALRVEIGAAKGHNWWCVLFPPLCFLNMSGPLTPVRIQQEQEPSEKPQVTIEFANPFSIPFSPVPVVVAPMVTNN